MPIRILRSSFTVSASASSEALTSAITQADLDAAVPAGKGITPLAFILDAYRQVLLHATAPDWTHLLQIGCGSVVLLIVVVLIMRRASQYLALKALS